MFNASSLKLFQVTQMPNMARTVASWSTPLTFGIVTKEQSGFYTKETVRNISFSGTWQPFDNDRLQLKPEGQRDWKWYWVHSQIDLGLKDDDIIKFNGKQFRVMTNKDWKLSGYYEYEIIEDFTGAGPRESE